MVYRRFRGCFPPPGIPLRRPRRLRLDQVTLLQSLAEQVVLAVEQTFSMPGARKKEIARLVLRGLLMDFGITVPFLSQEVALEAAVRLMKLLEEV